MFFQCIVNWNTTLSFDARGEDVKFKYQCVNTLGAFLQKMEGEMKKEDL